MTPDDPLQLAAPAPLDDEDDPSPEEMRDQGDQETLCWAWAAWSRTRRLYVKPSLPPSVLGRLRSPGTGRSRPGGGPDAIASADLMAFHIAYLAQPEDALDRRAFTLHYYTGVRNIKAAADAIGVSRRHWYRLVTDCRQRIYTASRQILEQNLAAGAALPSVAVKSEGVTS